MLILPIQLAFKIGFLFHLLKGCNKFAFQKAKLILLDN